MTAPVRKRCSKCNKSKPVDQFYGFRRGKLGVQAWCKNCVNKRKRELRANRRRSGDAA